MPSGRLVVAFEGQTSKQGAYLHWLQRTASVVFSSPLGVSCSKAINLGQVTLKGKKCSILQAATHPWQRTHFERFITIPHLIEQHLQFQSL